MVRLRTKLALFNFLSKLVFTSIFIAIMPFLVERINILQTDNELIKKREQVIDLISRIGIEPFITTDSVGSFGSYNILKDEFISLERIDLAEDWNFIEVTERMIDDETIDYRVLNYSFKVDDQTYLLEIGKSLASILNTKKNIRTLIWIFLIFIILITLFSDLYFTNRILHPFDLIIRKLKGTSSPSLFDKTPVNTTTSDFRQLDQTLGDLMIRIDELFQKEKDITVNISHELMTPVSVLRSKFENLLLQENIDDDTAAQIEESLRILHRLKALVNSLLLIARIESKQYLKDESFSIKEVIKEVLSEISPIANDTEISLSDQVKVDFVFKRANRSLIFSMLYNVINNAVKNTPSKGKVRVTGENTGSIFKITISDTGQGMNEEQLRNMFSRFSKKLYSEEENSTGIGLAITKSIADFHNIEIVVDSEIHSGTTFSFIFPENS
jgi:signal transduction histidine kinase